VGRGRRFVRALLARRIMRHGVERLSRLDPSRSASEPGSV
jgi:hypothetical protein